MTGNIPARENEGMREFLTAAARCGRTRALLIANEFDAIGIALTHNLISADDAIDELHQLGIWKFLLPQLGSDQQ